MIPQDRPTTGADHAPPRRTGRLFVAGLLLVAAILAAYWPAIRGDFIWDDDVYVTENRLLWEPDGLRRIWLTTDFESQFFPLTITVLRAGYQLWGFETIGYHLLNVAVHAINALLVWILLARLGVPAAGLAAAIFALHPVQVESVAWITEIKNLLSTMLYLLAIGAYLRFDDTALFRWYGVAFVLFGLALLSKTTACTLPAALLVIRWWLGKSIGLRDVLLLLPLFIAGVGMGLFVAWYETTHIGTTGAEFQLSMADRLLIAGRAPWFYLGTLVFPAHLAFSYPRWPLEPADPVQWLWIVGSVVAALALWFGREWLGRAPAAGFAFFIVVLSPMLGFVSYYTMRYSFVADHYQYLACVGPIALAAGGGATLAARWQRSRSPAAVMVAATVVVLLGALTWQQAHAYANRETLWRNTIANNPGSWMGHNNLGNVLVDQGRLDEALEHYEEARRLNPTYADPYSNIGGILVRRGQYEKAIEYFHQAITLDPGDTDFSYNLAIALAKAGRRGEAMATLEGVLARLSRHAPAHNNLGVLLEEEDRLDEAIGHYRAAVQHAPEELTFRENLAAALVARGDTADAAAEYRAALRHAPSSAALHADLGRVLGQLGRFDEAIAAYEQAVELDPDDVDLRFDLGVQLAQAGRAEEAVGRYREVLGRTPDDAAAANNLGAVLLSLGRTDEAAASFSQALAQAPDDVDVRANLALTLRRTGKTDRAIDMLQQGIAESEAPVLLNALAWIRATDPVARYRDGDEAVRLAERACIGTDRRNPNYLDTLAAAYAEAGRFAEATRTVRQALALTSGTPNLAADLKARLVLYEAGQPYREPAGD